MYPGQIILLSARVREGHILRAKFRLGGKRGGARPGHRGAAASPAGAAHASAADVRAQHRGTSSGLQSQDDLHRLGCYAYLLNVSRKNYHS